MKLLVFSSVTKISTANYLVRALMRMGHDTVVCSDIPTQLAQVKRTGTVDVAQLSLRLGLTPDAVLFFEGGTMRLMPVNMESLGCVTAWYGIDTHMDYQKHLRLSRLFDVTFVAQKEFVDRLREDGIKQVFWLPLAFDPQLLPEAAPKREIDIAYIGSVKCEMNPLRHVLLERIKQEFPAHYFGTATPKEMGRLYASSKVVFNQSVRNDINMRFFEAMGSGSVLVTNPIHDNGLEELFVEGIHYLTFKDEASLLQVIHKILAQPLIQEEIGNAAKQLVLEKHTYDHRAKKILEILGGSRKMSAPQPEDYFAACLSLNLLSGSLMGCARAFKSENRGRYRRWVGQVLSWIMFGLAMVFRFLEGIRKAV